jgi:hypothetical protein
MTHSHTHTLPRVFIGATYQSRTGSEYRIVALDRKGGFTAERIKTRKTVKISSSLLRRVSARAAAGETFAYQRNSPQGGISYTVAVEAGVVYALALSADDATRTYRSAR